MREIFCILFHNFYMLTVYVRHIEIKKCFLLKTFLFIFKEMMLLKINLIFISSLNLESILVLVPVISFDNYYIPLNR